MASLFHPASLRAGLLLSLAGSSAVFAADYLLAPDVSLLILYALVVLFALGAPDPRAILCAALVATVFVWIDALSGPAAAAETGWLLQVALVLSVIWVAALVAHRNMVAARTRVERSYKETADIKWAIDQSAIVAITDPRGVIKYVNDNFCELSKYSRDELIGRDHRIINSGYHPKAFIRELWQTIQSGRIWKGELRNRAKDGTIYWVDTTIVPFLDEHGKPYQYMAIRFDITERKRSESLLQEQAALTRLGEMAAVVAHEVKNPLAGIRGALQVIGGRMPAESRDRSVISDILARLDTLNELVHDLLLFARPSAPKLAPVPLGPLLETTAVLLKRDPQLAQVEVVVRAGTETVVADSELLQIVFSNLLINSAQAMNGAGCVTLTVAQRQKHCEIAVHDTGPGMPSEIRERVFEPFFTTKHRGTGLGLSTARRLVELHGGTVTAECPPGGGTVVTISLPVRTGTAAASGGAAAHAAGAV